MKMSGIKQNWINVPINVLDKGKLTEANICTFCETDKDECGEYAECCYRSVIEAYEEQEIYNEAIDDCTQRVKAQPTAYDIDRAYDQVIEIVRGELK